MHHPYLFKNVFGQPPSNFSNGRHFARLSIKIQASVKLFHILILYAKIFSILKELLITIKCFELQKYMNLVICIFALSLLNVLSIERIICIESKERLQQLLDTITENAENVGLKINIEKSKA